MPIAPTTRRAAFSLVGAALVARPGAAKASSDAALIAMSQRLLQSVAAINRAEAQCIADAEATDRELMRLDAELLDIVSQLEAFGSPRSWQGLRAMAAAALASFPLLNPAEDLIPSSTDGSWLALAVLRSVAEMPCPQAPA